MIGKKMVEVWVTKYALTRGILCLPGEIDPEDPGNCYVGKLGYTLSKGDWHLLESDAKAKVLKMIKSERKSIAEKLEKLDRLEADCK